MPSPPPTSPEHSAQGRHTISADPDADREGHHLPDHGISKADQLTKKEKGALHDLLKHWVAMRPSAAPEETAITAALEQFFFDRIFDLWTSFDDFILLPTLPEKKFSEVAVKVGKVTQNLPLAPGKRKHGEEAQKKSNRNRFYSTHTYLNIHLNVSEHHRAIMNWDRCEMRRVERHKTDAIVAPAQNRIIDFAKAGTSLNPRIKKSNQVNNRIVPLQLTIPLLGKLLLTPFQSSSYLFSRPP
ncbi:hypothetical protein FDECE_15217 [Fusarium decemcellulare]|nr:hypothetical protein FDECE_15217 [Fusarium decemcellulare]